MLGGDGGTSVRGKKTVETPAKWGGRSHLRTAKTRDPTLALMRSLHEANVADGASIILGGGHA